MAETPTKPSAAGTPAAAFPATVTRRDRIAGILLMLAATSILPFNDAIAKSLTAGFLVVQVVWARFAFHALMIGPAVIARHGVRALWPERPWVQIARGFLIGFSTLCFVTSISRVPMADAVALLFVTPLLVTALSPFLLGESVGPRRWAAVIVGFIGVLIVVRPGADVTDPYAFFALGAGVSNTFYVILTRTASTTAPPLVSLFYTGLIPALGYSLALPFVWQLPTALEWGMMVAMAACGAMAHLLLIGSYTRAPAPYLQPFAYNEITMSVVIGFLVFGDFPDAVTWGGIAVIVASGIYISFRERVRREGSP